VDSQKDEKRLIYLSIQRRSKPKNDKRYDSFWPCRSVSQPKK